MNRIILDWASSSLTYCFFVFGFCREKLVLESISDLVADVAMLVRGGDTDSAAVQKVCRQAGRQTGRRAGKEGNLE